ncbi:putative multi-domain containing protein [Aduncisulcus paluster]|uniref:peptidyl-tRNA hydrolase n=1 Tax=Aduncisulcus paluster TaxID=2918883 RepID=A0ABQ5K682_9EUKA|nr:putative multi-domain containing protein [Aduncisulcus paluster]GKT26737.1 putative multi-domain containing protein [Aduncisulcus paluster]GKT26739.1 putative multi-domain containing protein [Aduncisulcus paluster]
MCDNPLQLVVIIRKDLDWPSGPIISQAVHASVKILEETKDRPETKEYLLKDNLPLMHTVILGVKSLTKLKNVKKKLDDGGIPSCIWIETPEMVETALGVAPSRKSDLAPFLKKLRLF